MQYLASIPSPREASGTTARVTGHPAIHLIELWVVPA